MNPEVLLKMSIVNFVIVTSFFASYENLEVRRVFHVPEGGAALERANGLSTDPRDSRVGILSPGSKTPMR